LNASLADAQDNKEGISRLLPQIVQFIVGEVAVPPATPADKQAIFHDYRWTPLLVTPTLPLADVLRSTSISTAADLPD
jgi:hypothetical protein